MKHTGSFVAEKGAQAVRHHLVLHVFHLLVVLSINKGVHPLHL